MLCFLRRCLVFVVLLPMTTHGGESMSVDIKRLTIEAATKVVHAAMVECRKKGIQIAVAVVDRGGNMQIGARDTLAVDLTLRIAREKAYTAISFNTATSALANRSASALGSLDGLVMAGGGLPIDIGGNIYGAVGVSGAPSSKTDEACARAGINAIIEDLEMAD